MKKLLIRTRHPETTIEIIERLQLAPGLAQVWPDRLVISWPDDALSQEIYFWGVLAKGAGLIEEDLQLVD